MTPAQYALVQRLADGGFISGEALGKDSGISRAAVWKQLQQLEGYGLRVESVKGRGYRIPGGLDLLDSEAIVRELKPINRPYLAGVHLEPVLDSTNSWLMRQLAAGTATPGVACFAEQQTSGRGRRGRTWVSPFGRNLYCSLAWQFEQGVSALEGLSLAVGVATVTALERLGYPGVRLKWPNDLLWQSRKLGGMLLEISGDAAGTCQVVIGIGLNINMPQALAESVDQPWANLNDLLQANSAAPSRNRLAGTLLDELIAMLRQFQREGFASFHSRWEEHNAHLGQQVIMVTPAREVAGRVLGINPQGGLRLEVDGAEQLFLGGEISLRSGA